MRMTKHIGNFFITFLFNLLINLHWSLPAWVLLVLHYTSDWRILWFWIAIGVWLLSIFLWMGFIKFAANSSAEKQYRENKNPYSATADKYPTKKSNDESN